jgi:hypothetical protein
MTQDAAESVDCVSHRHSAQRMPGRSLPGVGVDDLAAADLGELVDPGPDGRKKIRVAIGSSRQPGAVGGVVVGPGADARDEAEGNERFQPDSLGGALAVSRRGSQTAGSLCGWNGWQTVSGGRRALLTRC